METTEGNIETKPDILFNQARICRFCLSPAGVLSPIFEQGEANSLPLSSKIMAFASIQVYANDGLPSLICHRCLYQVEKSYDFKNQCEASDAMLRKYMAAIHSSFSRQNSDSPEGIPTFDSFTLAQFQKSMLHASVFNDSPFKRKRGRPRKEENLIFYSSPVHTQLEAANGVANYQDDEIKIVDGIESVVTVVDPRSEMLSNSDDENRLDGEKPPSEGDKSEVTSRNEETLDSLAKAKAKAKKYMGIVIGVDENGTRSRRHLCKGCGKTFGHCSDLRKHVLVHTGERPFHCQICTKTFSRSTNLNKHMKVHTGQKPFFCTDCPKSFATKGDLQRHLIIHSGIKPFACHLCSQCFSRKDKLTRHLKLHEGSGLGKMNFKCTHCSAVYHSKVDLKQHVETMHFKDIKTEDDEDARSNSEEPCVSSSVDMSIVKEEESSNDKDVYVKREVENSHSEDENPPDEVESMVINIDPFQMDSDLNDMNNSWENDKSRSESDYQTIETNGEIEESEEKPQKSSKASHKDKSSLQCKICHKKFTEITYLRSHMATHSVLKPHKCSMCEKSFTRRRELLRHENVHTGYKPFKCLTCSKAFSRKDKLARHEKIHNGLKKFSCRICTSVSFTKVEELLLHHRTAHSDESPTSNGTKSKGNHADPSSRRYHCSVCSVHFVSLKMFEEHSKTHEADAEETPNGVGYDSDELNSDEEKSTNDSLEQLNSNPAITVMSVTKSVR